MFNLKTLSSVILILSLSTLAAPSFAMEKNAEDTIHTTSSLQNIPVEKLITKKNAEYMRPSYTDTNIRLIGPISFTIEDNLTERRFRNLTTSRAQLVNGPNNASYFETSQYYKATIAKAGFKLKF